ncbi:MAG: trypsin-like peptidase domain-containing protein [Holophagales bacterium]|nr:trypsin-like peptidase domain-containing protein [Holophagales bacterium]
MKQTGDVFRRIVIAAVCCSAATLALGAAQAAEVGPALRPGDGPEKAAPPPLYLAKSNGLEPRASLKRAEVAVPGELESLAEWNAAGNLPTKIGFFRALPAPEKVAIGLETLEKARALGATAEKATGTSRLDLDQVRETSSGLVWTTRVRVEGAWGLRAKLSRAELPEGTELWVYGEAGDYSAFGAELVRPDGDLWTPAVGGEVLDLEVRIPHAVLDRGEVLRFELDQVAELFRLDNAGAPLVGDRAPEKFCTESAACWTHPDPAFDLMKRATSYLEIVFSGGVGTCSGTLMNSTDGLFRPYFLTANHCIDNQNDATSTSFYFDYIPSSCGGSDPSLFSLPRVNGAQLLANRPASDSSFFELSSQPGGSRAYAGWTTTNPSVAENLRSFSHPNGRSMRYSRTSVVPGGGCGLSETEYVFSDQELGGVQGGSSGSHILNNSFRVVGQLRGACGLDPSNGCFWSLNNRFDGRFSRFYGMIEPWLNPTTSTCVPSSTTLCLNNDRFSVTAGYTTREGATGDAQKQDLTADTGYFWFFNSDNVEVVVKVLDACVLNNQFWVFAGGLTDLGVDIFIRDTVTGNTWSGSNQVGVPFVSVADTSALSCN